MSFSYKKLLQTSEPEPRSEPDHNVESQDTRQYPVGTLTEIDEISNIVDAASSDIYCLGTHAQLIGTLCEDVETMNTYIRGPTLGHLPAYNDKQIDRMWTRYEIYYTLQYSNALKEEVRHRLEEVDRDVKDQTGQGLSTLSRAMVASHPSYQNYKGRETGEGIRGRLEGILDRLFNDSRLQEVCLRRFIMTQGTSLVFRWDPQFCRYTAVKILLPHTYWGSHIDLGAEDLNGIPSLLMLEALRAS
ncbi:hypothetical protein PVAG01_03962 [Phlyctema vagabunda]|uniref:Uncharacterized protein n=1 Tax=Phlyctema vagabunda TaxID=108571 RepID=A0ABR4PMX1_9HELO